MPAQSTVFSVSDELFSLDFLVLSISTLSPQRIRTTNTRYLIKTHAMFLWKTSHDGAVAVFTAMT